VVGQVLRLERQRLRADLLARKAAHRVEHAVAERARAGLLRFLDAPAARAGDGVLLDLRLLLDELLIRDARLCGR
jgi:hypothetical protein